MNMPVMHAALPCVPYGLCCVYQHAVPDLEELYLGCGCVDGCALGLGFSLGLRLGLGVG